MNPSGAFAMPEIANLPAMLRSWERTPNRRNGWAGVGHASDMRQPNF
jgi:hypothetical protein